MKSLERNGTKLRKRHRVTLIVGIVARDGIVLAADSQTSYGGMKIPGTNKIAQVDFQGGKGVLIAEAGMVKLSNQAVQIIKDKAKDVAVSDKEHVANVVRDALMEVRCGQIALYPSGTHSLEDWKVFFRDQNPVELTVAFYIRTTPFLFTITLDECIPHFSKDYSASGCGDSLGNYLLKEHFAPDMSYELAMAIAIKIAKDAAIYVEGCDGPIKAAFIQPLAMTKAAMLKEPNPKALFEPEMVITLPPEKVTEIIAIIAVAESQAKHVYLDKIHKFLLTDSRKAMIALIEQLDSEFKTPKRLGLSPRP